MSNSTHAMTWRNIAVLAVAVASSAGCYVVPATAPDGTVYYSHYPLPPVGTPIAVPPPATSTAPATLPVKLYPSNDQASHTGIVSGSVTNMMTGKGRFVVNYLGEVLGGETMPPPAHDASVPGPLLSRTLTATPALTSSRAVSMPIMPPPMTTTFMLLTPQPKWLKYCAC